MLFRAKEEAKAFLEKRYPDHDFCWQEKGRRLWGLCPAHPDRNIGNFGIYFDKKADGWGFYCFACGFSHHQFKKLSPFQQDIEIFVNDLRDQVESESQLGYLYLASRIPNLDYYEDIFFEQFEVGYHFYSRKFADEFSKAFKDKVINIDDLWEPSGKDQNYNFEWIVFVYRSLRGQATSLKFRNIAIDKDSLKWKQHGIKTVKLADNETGIFGYRNLFAEAPVLIIVEGEFDAITTTLLTELKYPAVAVSGASGFNKSMIMQIIRHKAVKDKVIVIQPDWDAAGETALNQLINELPENILKGHKLYTLPKPNEDVKDLDEYLRDDPDIAIEKIEELFKNAISLAELRERKKEEEKKKQRQILEQYPIALLNLIDKNSTTTQIKIVKTFENDDVPKPPKVFCDVFPAGYISMLAAPSALGKTYAAIHFALKYIEETQKDVCIWLSEDVEQTKYRVYQMLNKTNWEQKKDLLKDKIYHIESLPEAIIINNNNKYKVNDSFFDALKQVVEKFNFIVLDPIANFFASSENDNVAARLFMNTLSKLIFKTDKVILLVHHTNKNNANITDKDDIEIIKEAFKEKIRGATSFVDAARSVLYLLPHKKPISLNSNEKEKRKAVKAIVIKSNVVPIGKTELIQLPFAYEDSRFEEIKDSFALVK